MLLEIAIGDAYGRPFEFASRDFIRKHNDLKGYHIHPGNAYYPGDEPTSGPILGRYTDDEQMSLAVADYMLDSCPVTQESFADKFMQAYKRDPRKGYSKRITNLLTTSQSPADFIQKSIATKGNGCVMRTLPLGLLSKPEHVIHAAITHASITHGSIEGINATVAIALTAHYYYHKIQEHYFTWMGKHMGNLILQQIIQTYQGGEIECDAMQTASVCIKIVRENNSMADMLLKSVSVGGDVDSVAAVVMGLASLKCAENNLPKILYDNLESGTYGKDYIKTIDQKLFNKFPRN